MGVLDQPRGLFSLYGELANSGVIEACEAWGFVESVVAELSDHSSPSSRSFDNFATTVSDILDVLTPQGSDEVSAGVAGRILEIANRLEMDTASRTRLLEIVAVMANSKY